ncbi:hypothetical protein SGRI78S_00020 [Streptomyces griseus subsp. griseus]
MAERTRDQAGIFYIDVPSWTHTQMPHPLGRLADLADRHGRVWAVTSHIQLIERLIKAGHITEPLCIHDSWTGRANESLFQHFYKEARRARTELVDAGAPYDQYKRRLSIALRLLWPKGDTVKSPLLAARLAHECRRGSIRPALGHRVEGSPGRAHPDRPAQRRRGGLRHP